MLWRRKETDKKLPEEHTENRIAKSQKYYRVLFIGSKKSGSKTTLISKYSGTNGSPAYKELPRKDNTILELWDDPIDKLRDFDCIVIGFDITDRKSYNTLLDPYRKLLKENPHIAKIIIGNKSDLSRDRKVTQDEGHILADYVGACGYFEGNNSTF